MQMLFLLCESAIELFNNNAQTITPNTVELTIEQYNSMIQKMYDLHKRVQHLELQEWKKTHGNWFKDLFNISTAYETIDEMFKVKHEASVDDFGNLINGYDILVYNYSTYRDEWTKTSQFCYKTGWNLTYTTKCLNEYSCGVNYNQPRKCCTRYAYEYKLFSNYTEAVDENKGNDIKLACIESKPMNETNIIGYINYKHAFNTNDDQWLINQVQKLINDNKHLYFEDYVNLFREKYYRIVKDDERLYKLIQQEMKEFKAKNKKVKIW